MLYKPTLKNSKNNVKNNEHETHALAYTFKAGSWQI